MLWEQLTLFTHLYVTCKFYNIYLSKSQERFCIPEELFFRGCLRVCSPGAVVSAPAWTAVASVRSDASASIQTRWWTHSCGQDTDTDTQMKNSTIMVTVRTSLAFKEVALRDCISEKEIHVCGCTKQQIYSFCLHEKSHVSQCGCQILSPPIDKLCVEKCGCSRKNNSFFSGTTL